MPAKKVTFSPTKTQYRQKPFEQQQSNPLWMFNQPPFHFRTPYQEHIRAKPYWTPYQKKQASKREIKATCALPSKINVKLCSDSYPCLYKKRCYAYIYEPTNLPRLQQPSFPALKKPSLSRSKIIKNYYKELKPKKHWWSHREI